MAKIIKGQGAAKAVEQKKEVDEPWPGRRRRVPQKHKPLIEHGAANE